MNVTSQKNFIEMVLLFGHFCPKQGVFASCKVLGRTWGSSRCIGWSILAFSSLEQTAQDLTNPAALQTMDGVLVSHKYLYKILSVICKVSFPFHFGKEVLQQVSWVFTFSPSSLVTSKLRSSRNRMVHKFASQRKHLMAVFSPTGCAIACKMPLRNPIYTTTWICSCRCWLHVCHPSSIW